MTRFEWDDEKERSNQEKHGIGFRLARYAFADTQRVIAEDAAHSTNEDRFFCVGRVGDSILTVRFTYRGDAISALIPENTHKKQENSLLSANLSPSPSGRGLGVRVGEAISSLNTKCSTKRIKQFNL